MEQGEFTTNDGVQLHYLESGRPGRADFPHPVLHERDSLAAA
jgi:hypothetical protein